VHLDEFLQLPAIRDSVKQTSPTQWQCLCPAHADSATRSLCIGKGADGRILLACQSGCGTGQVLQALGLTMKDLFPEAQRTRSDKPGEVVATYDYRDEAGVLLFQVVRFKPKSFRQRRPGTNGQPWIWDLNDTRRVLYRLPELLKANPGEWVFIPEGEKDVDRVVSLGLTATCNSGGAGKWMPTYSEALRGRKVCILPDNDTAGQTHAQKVAAALAGIAAEVRVLCLPDLPPKGDVSDWIEAGGTREELLRMIEKAESFKAEATTETTPTFNLTDSGNAERFIRRCKDLIRFDWSRGLWLFYDGRRWNAETGNEMANRFAFETARAIILEADGRTYAERQKLMEWAHRSEGAARLAAILNVARSLSPMGAYTNQFDTDDFVLNVANGTINLRTGRLTPHRPADMISKLSPVAYDPDAKLDLWDQFLDTVCQRDECMKAFLQTAVGYSVTGDTREDRLFLVNGPAASGKSTLLEAIKATLGDYAVTTDFETFLQRNQVGGARSDVARLAGARFVVSIEVEEGKRLAEALVKTICGGDTVSARHLYQAHFEFRPQCKLWLACNDTPRVSDTDTGLWRRILRVPFEHTIPSHERDPAVKMILRDPELAGPAILAWIVQGCLRWQREGLIVPEFVEEATEEYRQEQDPLRDFLEEECLFAPWNIVPVAELRRRYDEWARECGLKFTLSPQQFNRRLETRGCTRRATQIRNELGTEKIVKCWRGVTLSASPKTRSQEQADDEIPI